MKAHENILNQIVELTTHIETNYPELYTFIDEIPLTVSAASSTKTNTSLMEDYLESLKQMLGGYIKTHGNTQCQNPASIQKQV